MTAVLAAALPRVGTAGDATAPAIGARGQVGCGPDPRRVQRLLITEPGVYENILVDGEWGDGTLVKITADGVTLRNCEVRNGRHNAVTVYAKDVVIESCKIHHALADPLGTVQLLSMLQSGRRAHTPRKPLGEATA